MNGCRASYEVNLTEKIFGRSATFTPEVNRVILWTRLHSVYGRLVQAVCKCSTVFFFCEMPVKYEPHCEKTCVQGFQNIDIIDESASVLYDSIGTVEFMFRLWMCRPHVLWFNGWEPYLLIDSHLNRGKPSFLLADGQVVYFGYFSLPSYQINYASKQQK